MIIKENISICIPIIDSKLLFKSLTFSTMDNINIGVTPSFKCSKVDSFLANKKPTKLLFPLNLYK